MEVDLIGNFTDYPYEIYESHIRLSSTFKEKASNSCNLTKIP